MSTPESNVWDDPIQTEGVSATDQPASPGEQVVDAPAVETPQVEPQPKETTAAATVLDWTTAPEQFRAAHEAEKPLRELVKEVGGLEVLREAVELDDLWRNPTVDASAKIERLRQASEREFERVGGELVEQSWQRPEWRDYLLSQTFGEGVTAERIKQLLSGSAGSSQPPPAFDAVADAREVLNDPLATERERALAQHTIKQAEEQGRQAEALRKVPQLEEKVNSFDKLQTERMEEQRTALAGEFLQVAFSPVDEVIKNAGLAPLPNDPPEEVARKAHMVQRLQRDVFDELYGNALANPQHENHALAKEIDGYLSNRDRLNAWRKLPKVQALAEKAAARFAQYYSATYSQARKVQSQPLEREPNPPVINGQGASFGNTDTLPRGREVWDDQTMPDRWKEIAAS